MYLSPSSFRAMDKWLQPPSHGGLQRSSIAATPGSVERSANVLCHLRNVLPATESLARCS